MKNLLHLNNGQAHFLPVTIPLAQFQGKTGRFKVRFGEVHPVISNMVGSPGTKQAKISNIQAGIEESPPAAFRLLQNYPNPFNPTTTITFDLPRVSELLLEIYDITGRKVRTLMDEQLPAGVHQVAWDGRDDRGAPVSSGIYIYRIEAGNPSTSSGQVFVESRKMILMR